MKFLYFGASAIFNLAPITVCSLKLHERVNKTKIGLFPFMFLVRYAPPVTEHVPLHSKSSFKNITHVICTQCAERHTRKRSPKTINFESFLGSIPKWGMIHQKHRTMSQNNEQGGLLM